MTNKNRQRFFLSKNKILRGERTIKRVFDEGTFVKGRWFDVVYLCRTEFDEFKIAFAAARRARNAVERNCIKRKLREAFRLEQMALQPQCYAVVIGNTKIIKADLAAVRVEMKRVFGATGLMILHPRIDTN